MAFGGFSIESHTKAMLSGNVPIAGIVYNIKNYVSNNTTIRGLTEGIVYNTKNDVSNNITIVQLASSWLLVTHIATYGN